MQYILLDTIENLKKNPVPTFIEGMPPEYHAQCISMLADIPFSEMKVALGVQALDENIHTVLIAPHFYMVIRFSLGIEPNPVAVDEAAAQARNLATADVLQGKPVFAAVVQMGATNAQALGQVQIVPPAQFNSFLGSLLINSKDQTVEMPDFSLVEPNAQREREWTEIRKKDVQAFQEALFEGSLDKAAGLAKQLRRFGHALYITQNIKSAQDYCRFRGDESPILRSDKAYNLLALRSENTENDFTLRRKIAQCAWGEDLRWVGKWKTPGDEQRKEETIAFYSKMLLAGEQGFIIYMPPTAEMAGTLRALRDAGLMLW